MGDDELYADFERDGEDTVRNNLAAGRYNSRKARLAKEWLQRKELLQDDESGRRREAREAAQLEAVARASAAAERAADAAERSARAAEQPNTRATIANIIAAAALVMATISIITSLLK